MAAAKKSTAKKATAKKATAKKGTAKKAAAKKSTAKKSTAKSAAKKSTAKKSTGKKAAAKKTTGASSGNESVLVASKLKEAIRSHDAQMAGEFLHALNDQVHELVSKAVKRAKGNNRKTVRPDDL